MSPTYREGPNKTTVLQKFEVIDFVVTMELHCNGKILNLKRTACVAGPDTNTVLNKQIRSASNYRSSL